jgi:hypothetical protein
VTLLSTIVALLALWAWGCSQVGRGPLNALIFGVWSLKEVGVRNHLPLWGDKSLFSCLRHWLKTLSDGVEGRSNRRRTNTGPRVPTLLALVLLLVLA